MAHVGPVEIWNVSWVSPFVYVCFSFCIGFVFLGPLSLLASWGVFVYIFQFVIYKIFYLLLKKKMLFSSQIFLFVILAPKFQHCVPRDLFLS